MVRTVAVVGCFAAFHLKANDSQAQWHQGWLQSAMDTWIRSFLIAMYLLMGRRSLVRIFTRPSIFRKFRLLPSSTVPLVGLHVFNEFIRKISNSALTSGVPSCYAWSRQQRLYRCSPWCHQPHLPQTESPFGPARAAIGRSSGRDNSHLFRYISSESLSSQESSPCVVHGIINGWAVATTPFSAYADHVEIGEFVDERSSSTSCISSVGEHIERGSGDTKWRGEPSTSTLTVVNAIEYVIQSHQQHQNAQLKQTNSHLMHEWLTPLQLLYLGAVWYLPAEEYLKQRSRHIEDSSNDAIGRSSRRSENNRGIKPRRLEIRHATEIALKPGDYLRIHHTPRRFPIVHNFLWSKSIQEKRNDSVMAVGDTKNEQNCSTSRGVVVSDNNAKGFLVINKPPMVPVHSTVDNSIENVVYQIQHATPTSTLREPIQASVSPSSSLLSSLEHLELPMASDISSSRDYVAPVQRLDVNTSGLLLLATTKSFATYFSKLLSHKTARQLQRKSENSSRQRRQTDFNLTPESSSNTTFGISKGYRCLVCVLEPESPPFTDGVDFSESNVIKQYWRSGSWSVEKAVQELKDYASQRSLIRHYLESSVRSPKRFEPSIPIVANEQQTGGANDTSVCDWLECLLQIRRVRCAYLTSSSPKEPPNAGGIDYCDDIISLSHSRSEQPEFIRFLWPSPETCRPPPNLRAVVELDIHLITGRTHQIRGQLSRMGYPIVGDEQYGGAIPVVGGSHESASIEILESPSSNSPPSSQAPMPQLLALQCCELGFFDPDFCSTKKASDGQDVINGRANHDNARKNLKKSTSKKKKRPASIVGFVSNRWNQFRLENSAWWSPALAKYTRKEQYNLEEDHSQ